MAALPLLQLLLQPLASILRRDSHIYSDEVLMNPAVLASAGPQYAHDSFRKHAELPGSCGAHDVGCLPRFQGGDED